MSDDTTRVLDDRRTVWVFGAGASASPPYDVPVQAGLLKRLAEMSPPGRRERLANLEELRTKVAALCQKTQPGLTYTDSSVCLEEVFASSELVLSEARSTAAERHRAEEDIATLRDAMKVATQVFGRGDARKWKPHGRKGQSSPYAEMLEKIFPATGSGEPSPHSFITFNYDICLDRCAINLLGPAGTYLDYGISLSNARLSAAPTFCPPDGERRVLLLRTHGALNWVRCSSCMCVFTTVNKHANVSTASKCWACGQRSLGSVLVHPSYLRTYRDPIIQLVWGRCHEELVNASRWIFVGYSLPPADVHFRELLRCCLNERSARRKSTDVILVGRGPTDTDSFQSVEKTYRGLFASKLSVWPATANGFSDFVKQIR